LTTEERDRDRDGGGQPAQCKGTPDGLRSGVSPFSTDRNIVVVVNPTTLCPAADRFVRPVLTGWNVKVFNWVHDESSVETDQPHHDPDK